MEAAWWRGRQSGERKRWRQHGGEGGATNFFLLQKKGGREITLSLPFSNEKREMWKPIPCRQVTHPLKIILKIKYIFE